MNTNTNTNLITAVLDLAYDVREHDSIDEALAAFLAAVPFAEGTVLEAHGPGGWPVVRFGFPAGELEAFADTYGIEPDELRELL